MGRTSDQKRKATSRSTSDGNQRVKKRTPSTGSIQDTESDDIGEVMRLEQTGRQSRSFLAIPQSLQGLCFVAQAWVSEYTYFKNPLLNSLDVIHLVNSVWDFAQDREKSYQKRTKTCDSLVRYP